MFLPPEPTHIPAPAVDLTTLNEESDVYFVEYDSTPPLEDGTKVPHVRHGHFMAHDLYQEVDKSEPTAVLRLMVQDPPPPHARAIEMLVRCSDVVEIKPIDRT